jgi:hypothetical protein
MAEQRQRVVILYSHPLLGEGLGRLLTADPALQVELVRVDDLEGAEQALAGGPDVVVLERTAPIQALDLLRFAPSALFIDVGLDAGPSWTIRRDELSPQPEELLRAIHGRDGRSDGELAAPIPAKTAATAGPASAGAGTKTGTKPRTTALGSARA